MTDTGSSERPRRRWLWRLLFGASLALNLLIVGIVAGWVASKGPERTPNDVDRTARSLGMEPFVRALSPEDKVALVRSARSERAGLSENRRGLQSRLQSLLRAIRAEPFDPEDVRSLLSDQRAAVADRQAIGERLFLERLSQMSAEERASYAERLEGELKRGPRKR